VGHEYQIQLFYADERTTLEPGNMTMRVGESDPVTLHAGLALMGMLTMRRRR